MSLFTAAKSKPAVVAVVTEPAPALDAVEQGRLCESLLAVVHAAVGARTRIGSIALNPHVARGPSDGVAVLFLQPFTGASTTNTTISARAGERRRVHADDARRLTRGFNPPVARLLTDAESAEIPAPAPKPAPARVLVRFHRSVTLPGVEEADRSIAPQSFMKGDVAALDGRLVDALERPKNAFSDPGFTIVEHGRAVVVFERLTPDEIAERQRAFPVAAAAAPASVADDDVAFARELVSLCARYGRVLA